MRAATISEDYLKLIGLDGRSYAQVFLPCEICGLDDFETVVDKGRIGRVGEYGPVNIVQCRHCGHVMMNPRYEAQFYIDYYRKVYKHVGQFGGETPKVGFLDRQIERGEIVRRFLGEHGIAGGSMLDLGCSFGGAMIPFRDHGWTVHGIDPEEASVGYGQRELGLAIVYGRAEELPYATDSLDLVVSLGTLEHVHDFDATMSELRRVLKPGGHLFVRMRDNRPWGLIWEYFNKNHYRFFSEATHRLAVMRYGFDVLLFTARQVEGIPGHRYLICANSAEPSLQRVETAIAGGMKDSPAALRAYLRDHHESYLNAARELFALLHRCNGDLSRAAAEVDEERFAFGILDGDRTTAMERALFEARRVLEESGLAVPTL